MEKNESLRHSFCRLLAQAEPTSKGESRRARPGPGSPGVSAFHPVQPRPCRRPSPYSIRSSQVTRPGRWSRSSDMQTPSIRVRPSAASPSARVHFSEARQLQNTGHRRTVASGCRLPQQTRSSAPQPRSRPPRRTMVGPGGTVVGPRVALRLPGRRARPARRITPAAPEGQAPPPPTPHSPLLLLLLLERVMEVRWGEGPTCLCNHADGG